MRYVPTRRAAGVIALVLGATVLAGVVYDGVDDRDDLWQQAAATTGGNPYRGESMFIQYGCGSCPGLKHVRKASGMVGPPLDGIAVRAMIAGKLPNRSNNLAEW